MAEYNESTGHRDQETDREHERDVNSGGHGLPGALATVVGELQEVGSGLVVGAAAYADGVTSRNPYYQSGTVETGGYGGPPNVGAVTPVFATARHDALIFAGQIVDDTTGNAAAYGQGVGSGLAPELVSRTPLTGQAARDWEKSNVDAAATYQSAHPVMLHFSDEQIAAAQYADENGNPLDEDEQSSAGTGGSSSGSNDYDDHSDRAERQSAREGQRKGTSDPQGSQATSSGGQSTPQRSESRQGASTGQSGQVATGDTNTGDSTSSTSTTERRKPVDPTRQG